MAMATSVLLVRSLAAPGWHRSVFMSKLLKSVWHCDRCHHEWYTKEKPVRCSKCKARTWDSSSGTNGAAKLTTDLWDRHCMLLTQEISDPGIRMFRDIFEASPIGIAVENSEGRPLFAFERERSEASLRESEKLLRLAIEAGRMFAYSWDAATDVIELSGESAEILGIGNRTTQGTDIMASREHCLFLPQRDIVFKSGIVPRINLPPAAHGLATLRREFMRPLLVLVSAVAVVLLLACANLAG